MTCLKLTAKKKKFSTKIFSIKCDLGIWSHLLEKSLMENFIFCAAAVASDSLLYADDTCIVYLCKNVTKIEKKPLRVFSSL